MKIEYQRNLPHFQHLGRTFFVTWRLYGSLPAAVVLRLKQARTEQIARIKTQKLALDAEKIEINFAERAYFRQLDGLLDRAEGGPRWLAQPAVAQLVTDRLHALDGTLYRLDAYCVMANHVHALLDFSVQLPEEAPLTKSIDQYVQLYRVMARIKGSSAVAANRLLGRSGHFWAEETYDRYIRDYRHWLAAVEYIKQNPIKARLCTDWQQYPFTWVR